VSGIGALIETQAGFLRRWPDEAPQQAQIVALRHDQLRDPWLSRDR
jgi:hypothetical protein